MTKSRVGRTDGCLPLNFNICGSISINVDRCIYYVLQYKASLRGSIYIVLWAVRKAFCSSVFLSSSYAARKLFAIHIHFIALLPVLISIILRPRVRVTSVGIKICNIYPYPPVGPAPCTIHWTPLSMYWGGSQKWRPLFIPGWLDLDRPSGRWPPSEGQPGTITPRCLGVPMKIVLTCCPFTR